MTPKKLFAETMPFVMAKLMLGGTTVLLSIALLLILMGIGWLFGDTAIFIAIIIWIFGIRFIHLAVMQYMGYLVKAGHIAVIAEAFHTGKIPSNQVEHGKQMVTKHFATSNVYFAVDKLVTAAIKEVQKILDKAGNVLDFIPGIESVTELAKFFVQISLGYIDECCFGWTFYNEKEQNAYKSAADGVVIYVQNWKVLLKQAAMTMLKTIVFMIVLVLLSFIPIGLLFKLFKWHGFIAFLLACLVAWVVKFAVIDSYIMVHMMAAYLDVAPSTTITFDIYSEICKMSASFKELFKKAKVQAPVPVVPVELPKENNEEVKEQPLVAVAPVQKEMVQMDTPVNEKKAIFCGQCGAKNEEGSKFCGECGSKI